MCTRCLLAGEPEAQAAKDAETVMAIETRLAKASLTITEQRDPQNLNHPTDVASFSKELTHFSLADYVAAAHAPRRGQGERRGAEVLCGVQRAGGRYAHRPDQDVSALASAARLRRNQPAGELRPGELELLRAHAERRGEAAGALEALHQPRGSRNWARRWARSTWRATFRPKKSSGLEMTLAIEQAMDKDIDSLDWMSAATK
jgi:putative endopeptidase